jgi:hypothetical protein
MPVTRRVHDGWSEAVRSWLPDMIPRMLFDHVSEREPAALRTPIAVNDSMVGPEASESLEFEPGRDCARSQGGFR